jgi:DNA-binding NarL/FixJ family response regulator
MSGIIVASESEQVAEIVRESIRRVYPLEQVVVAPGWEVLKRCMRDERPQIVFMESNFFHSATAYLISQLMAENDKRRFGVFSFEVLSDEERELFYSLGAKGFVNLREDEADWGVCVKALLKGDENRCPELLRDMDAARIAAVNPFMTAREMQIIRLVCMGKSSIEIGKILGLHPKSVKNFKTHIYEKCGVKNNMQLLHLAVSMAWIELPEVPKVRIRCAGGVQ